VEGFAKVQAIADEDLERETEGKTSAVHFLRFEFTAEMIQSLRRNAAELALGCDHPAYQYVCQALSDSTRKSLLADLVCAETGGN